jgi:TonB-linked SusC/RagA family outer membrane protein
MKYIQATFILCAMFVLSPIAMIAQTVTTNETDSLQSEKIPQVQVAFRKVAQSDLLGGVSVIDMEALTKKNYNTYSLDNMQGYIGGWNGNSLWGMDANNAGYLVLVDGIPRDANNVLPTEIEQITFLKGAQAVVLYGSRAAKGVVYITTKRGKAKDLDISVRANTGFTVSKSYPEYLGSAEYMTLYNEARQNDGLTPLYSQTDIYNYASGLNPYRYPDVDFYSSEYIKKAYNRSDVTTEISGGGERVHFYSNIGYMHQNDLLDFGEAKNNGTNRLNVRGNVDMKINDYISAYVNSTASFYDAKSAKGNYWNAASTFRPNRLAPLVPLSYIDQNAQATWDLVNNTSNIIDGKYFLGGTQIDQTNVFADIYAGGSNKFTSRQFQFDTGTDFDLRKLLTGLSFQTKFAVDYSTSYNTSFDNKYSVYEPVWSNYGGSDAIVNLKKYGNDEKSGVQNVSGSSDKQTVDFSGQFNYVNTFNSVHNVSAMLIANGFQQTTSAKYHKVSNANLAFQLGYNYKEKYYVDFGASEVHSAKLIEANRNALSKSLTLGWRLSKENFLSNSSVVDNLMLSVSGSSLKQDIDITDFYMYKEAWAQAYGWSWYDGNLERYTMSTNNDYKNLDMVTRQEYSVNLRTELWKKTIVADASFFISNMDDMITKPVNSFPNYFSTDNPKATFVPYMNYDSNKRTGFDFSVYFNKRLASVDFTLGVSGTYIETEATKRNEINKFAYQNREGKPIDGIWGLQSAGFFQTQDEINNSPEQKFGGSLKPGDIKYIDQNNDNVIDSKDQIYLGKGGWYGAPFTLGVNLTAKWKSLTFFALGTGSYGASGMKDNSYYWVYGDGKYSAIVRNRWTEETKATATYPRLTTENGSNNFQASDFWLYKTNRFDLAKVQITYDLPKNVLRNGFIQEFSAYVNGANLLTISKERQHMEMNVGSAPQSRYYSIGIKALF